MKEHPLLMKGPLVRATLAGIKTQTRRPVTGNPPGDFAGWPVVVGLPGKHGLWVHGARGRTVCCPMGGAGDRLWVRETWTAAMHEPEGPADCLYRADDNPGVEDLAEAMWTPSIHMPRWACRLVLPLVSVRVERVQDITEDDAKAEGVEPIGGSYREGFREVWQSIYGTWDLNHWVWVAEWAEIEVSK